MNTEPDIHIHIHVHRAGADVLPVEKALATILKTQGATMTAISDFAAAQAAHNTRMTEALNGIGTDIAALNAKIAELQATSGAITAEDQGLLDDLQLQGEALAGRVEAADALTPPVVPAATS
jgi:hypothetical protein